MSVNVGDIVGRNAKFFEAYGVTVTKALIQMRGRVTEILPLEPNDTSVWVKVMWLESTGYVELYRGRSLVYQAEHLKVITPISTANTLGNFPKKEA